MTITLSTSPPRLQAEAAPVSCFVTLGSLLVRRWIVQTAQSAAWDGFPNTGRFVEVPGLVARVVVRTTSEVGGGYKRASVTVRVHRVKVGEQHPVVAAPLNSPDPAEEVVPIWPATAPSPAASVRSIPRRDIPVGMLMPADIYFSLRQMVTSRSDSQRFCAAGRLSAQPWSWEAGGVVEI
jgi:hypothetical protein